MSLRSALNDMSKKPSLSMELTLRLPAFEKGMVDSATAVINFYLEGVVDLHVLPILRTQKRTIHLDRFSGTLLLCLHPNQMLGDAKNGQRVKTQDSCLLGRLAGGQYCDSA